MKFLVKSIKYYGISVYPLNKRFWRVYSDLKRNQILFYSVNCYFFVFQISHFQKGTIVHFDSL